MSSTSRGHQTNQVTPSMRADRQKQAATGGPVLMLTLATIGFAVNFWAWALLSPLGPRFKDCSASARSSRRCWWRCPVVVGSLGRIPVGRADRPVRRPGDVPAGLDRHDRAGALPRPGRAHSLTALLVGGFFLGIGGTAFAVGVPFVNAWFPPERRGFAIGVFGAGMGGTAISALTTVKLVNGARHRDPVRDHRRGPGRLRRASPGCCCATRPAGSSRPSRSARAAGRRRAAADHLAGAASCTRSPSAATSRSPSTCRPT